MKPTRTVFSKRDSKVFLNANPIIAVTTEAMNK